MARRSSSAVLEQVPEPDSIHEREQVFGDALPELQWEQVFEIARKRLDTYLSLQPKVLQGEDPKAIHDLRVASRRLQEILDVLYLRPRPARIRKARRTLRRSRQALSTVRNCDVLLERVEKNLASRRRSLREPWEAFREYLIGRRSDSFRKATRKLGKLNMSSLYVRIKEELDTLHSAATEDAKLRNVSLSRQVGTSLQDAWAELDARVAESQEQRTAGAMHAVRLASKRLRYRMEILEDLQLPGSADAVEHLKHIQEELGDWNDLEVMEQMMLEMAGRPEYLREHLEVAMQIGRLVLRNRRGKEVRQEHLLKLFKEAAEYRQLGGWLDHFLSTSPAASREA